MKKKITILFAILSIGMLSGQALPDNIQAKYEDATSPSAKGIVLRDYIFPQKKEKSTNEILQFLYGLLRYFTKENDAVGTAYLHLHIGTVFQHAGDFSASLKYGVSAIRQFEAIGDTTALITSHMLAGNALKDFRNLDQAQNYYKKSYPIAKSYGDPLTISAILNNIADCYTQMKKPDSAFAYVNEAIAIAEKTNNTLYLASFLCTLGEAYFEKNDHSLGRPFIHKSLHYANQNDDVETMSYANNVLSKSFFETKETDSSLFYSYRALQYSEPYYRLLSANSYELLFKNYERLKLSDSAYHYLKLSNALQDSIFSSEKNRSMQALHFHEQMREQEMELEKQNLENRRRINIQYALAGAAVVTLLIIFLMLSHSMIVNTRMVKFFSIIGLLLVFEFFNLILHPILDKITNHSPIIMLFAMVAVAALLIPAHHKLEHWATVRLIEKNRKIRLAAAKKIISETGEESETAATTSA